MSLTRHWINVLLYTVTDKDIVFLVPDSCRMTVRNGNSISAKLHRGHHQKRLEQHLFLLILVEDSNVEYHKKNIITRLSTHV
jgi:hypothetical protein